MLNPAAVSLSVWTEVNQKIFERLETQELVGIIFEYLPVLLPHGQGFDQVLRGMVKPVDFFLRES